MNIVYNKFMLAALVLILTNSLAWYPVLNFWFLGGWEPAWLIGICGYNFNFVCLMQSHGILSFFNYFVFGWNPWGWYLSAIVLHICAVLLIYLFVRKLFKNGVFAFFSALLFGLNVAHNDVINWGSFEGLYALLMVSFLLSLLSHLRFRDTRGSLRLIWYSSALFLYLFGLFVREIAIALPFFILITELFLSHFKLSVGNIRRIFLRILPFGIVTIAYLFFRNWYGGAPHDFIDGMVQLRISLLGQGQYAEYVFRGVLSFGRYASSHAIPYPLINQARDIASHFFYAPYVTSYFFSVVGVGYFLLQVIIIWTIRKQKRLFHSLLFALLWFTIPTIFFSFAFSITDYELERPLVWNYTRWRYFAFFGTVIFWLALFVNFYEYVVKKHKTIYRQIRVAFIGFLILYLLLNIFFLRVIQKEIYEENFKPAKEFYQALTSRYKTLPEDYVFYYFPFAPSLNDRLAEFYYLRQEYYPNLIAERRDWTEGHMGMILDQLENRNIHFENIIFLDLTDTGGFYDRTVDVSRALETLSGQEYQLAKIASPSGVTVALDTPLHVEFPYIFEITARASNTTHSSAVSPAKRVALESYANERVSFLENLDVSVCKTASIGGRSADAMHFLPQNMIDGNIGKRSFWAADCRPAWVMLDLGSVKALSGILFRGEPHGPNVPSEYTVEISEDGENWERVVQTSGNSDYQRIEHFPETASGRYVRFTAVRTTQGGMLMLDALEVFGPDGLSAVKMYGQDVERLFEESTTYGKPYLHFYFETDPSNFAPNETAMHNSIYVPLVTDGMSHTYEIRPNENEYFSAQGQFLKRYISSITLKTTRTDSTIIEDMIIRPVYKPWYVKNSVQ